MDEGRVGIAEHHPAAALGEVGDGGGEPFLVGGGEIVLVVFGEAAGGIERRVGGVEVDEVAGDGRFQHPGEIPCAQCDPCRACAAARRRAASQIFGFL
jgi:hypothetical protein